MKINKAHLISTLGVAQIVFANVLALFGVPAMLFVYTPFSFVFLVYIVRTLVFAEKGGSL